MIVKFDKALYSYRAIRQAIIDYSSVADIDIIDSDDSFICSINKSRYDMGVTKLEFSNYVLNLSVMSEKTL